ncbi:MAG: HAD family phosphatase [Anaerolineales bacterium]|nr:MAG: HAD family phosphatase [Anaerolineales bacterium]
MNWSKDSMVEPVPFKAVLWDLGGVLLRTEDWEPRHCLDRMLDLPNGKIYELVFESEMSRKATIGEAANDELWMWVGEQLELSSDKLTLVRDEFWSGDQIDMELIRFIRARKTETKMGLLSNGWPSTRRFLDERWHIADIFDDMIISAEVGLAKPDRMIYQLALDRLGVEAEQTIFIDDFDENIRGARELGIHGIHFQSPQTVLEELKDLLGLTV